MTRASNPTLERMPTRYRARARSLPGGLLVSKRMARDISDAGVAGLTAQTAAEGAYYNVIINLPDIQDEKFTTEIKAKAETLKNEAVKISNEIRKIVAKELE